MAANDGSEEGFAEGGGHELGTPHLQPVVHPGIERGLAMKGQIPLEDHPVKAGSSRCDVAVELRQKLAGKTHDVLPVPRNR